ncbi:MAG: hypothetical protein GXZ11_05630 [Tissierellia bacterium]|nr:hypothetical protein [Tissierellia bacterium]
MGILSEIKLKDNYTSTANKVKSSLDGLGSGLKTVEKRANVFKSAMDKAFGKTYEVKIKDVKDDKVRSKLQKLQSEIRKTTGKDYKVKVSATTSAVDRLKSKLKSVKEQGKNIKMNVLGFIKAQQDARKLSRELSKITGKKHHVSLSLQGKGEVMRSLQSIGGKLAGLAKTTVIGLAAAGAAAVGAGIVGGRALWNAGSELEKQKISMGHFLGGDEAKSEEYLSALRKEANLTPFETGEVIAAGTRAVQITGGDTDRGMQMVKLAEDMAALTPGKTISDAMEALADADMGEMERLKEFGFKGSKEDFDAAGGDLFNMKDNKGDTLLGKFEGGAGKLAESGAGKFSTVMGNVKSGISDAGLKMLDRLKPSLSKLIPISEKIGTAIPEVFDKVVTAIEPLGEGVSSVFNALKTAVQPLLGPLSNLAGAVIPLFGSVLKLVSSVASGVLAPVFRFIGTVINSVVVPAFNWISGVISDYVVPAFDFIGGIINDYVEPAFSKIAELIGGAVTSVFNGLKSAVDWVIDKFNALKGAVSSVISFFSGLGGGGNPNGGLVPGGMAQYTKNATGTDYFSGGWTAINERGPELINLPRGARIFPAGESRKILNQNQNNESNSTVNNHLVINITGKDAKETGDEVERRIKRLIPNIA